MSKIIIYTDGACSGNPGPGAWAFVAINGDQLIEKAGFEAHTTNNRMELQAIQQALEICKTATEIDLYSDSNLAVQGLTQWIHGWMKRSWKKADGKEVLNKELWQAIWKVKTASSANIRFHHIRGHSGHYWNEYVDKMAVRSVKEKRNHAHKRTLEVGEKNAHV